jgi:hypothetical protein
MNQVHLVIMEINNGVDLPTEAVVSAHRTPVGAEKNRLLNHAEIEKNTRSSVSYYIASGS